VESLIAVAGVIVTIMVVVGMMLLTPRNVETATRPAPAPAPAPGEAADRTVG